MSGQSERKWTTLRGITNPEEQVTDVPDKNSEQELDVFPEADVPTNTEDSKDREISLDSSDKETSSLVQKHAVVVSTPNVEPAEFPELPPLPPVVLEEEEDLIVERTWFAPSRVPVDDSVDEMVTEEAPSILVPLHEEEPEPVVGPSIPGPVYVSLHSGFSEKQETESVVETEVTDESRVLVAHTVPSTSRLIRETLGDFTEAQVDTTSDPIRAFELALQKSYRLFYFPVQLGDLSGPVLYELICKAYSCGRGPKKMAPGVIFVREKEDPQLPIELTRDARVKDIISKPIRIERLLQSVEGVFEVRDPTGR